MWAQLVKTKVKPGYEEEVERLALAYETRDNPAYVKHFRLANTKDPNEHYILVFYVSEEEARRCECDLGQHMLALQLEECYSEPAVIVNLNPIHEHAVAPVGV